jgi:AraC-like DNA-binding protein
MVDLRFLRGEPHPGLRADLGAYVGYVERVDRPLVRREVAGGRCVLIVGWGAPIDIADPRGPSHGVRGVASFTGGLSDSYVDTYNAGVGQGIQLMLDPLVAGRLLGLPLGELANRVVALDDLGARDLKELPERLAAAASWPARFALLDDVFGRRLDQAPPTDPRLARIWDRLEATHGRIPIERLAAEVGWSRRHLATVTNREFGLAPKALARVLRFGRAYAMRERAATQGWAAVAAECGYYDQAHLIRDFHAFAGTTPSASVSSNPG